jgi:DNA-binding MarR family transcriptional regulator
MAKQSPSTLASTASSTAPSAASGRSTRDAAGAAAGPANATGVVDVADRLHSAAIHMLRYLRRADAATGLTAARASVLSVVVFGGPVTIGDLATAEQVSAPTMTKLITSLEGEGLVRRVPDERDRRVVRVHATPQAARILRRGRAARVRVLAATLRALDSADLTTLGRAADILRTLEERRRDQPAPPVRRKR